MERLNMQTEDIANINYEKLKSLFPNVITETIDENGNVVRAIDKNALMQEINTTVIDGNEERYQFTWPDKRKAIIEANTPTKNTLRPNLKESKNFDTTENLYIEGDNLEVLKILRETYLGKIKMVYIDPPYNTGSDFIYNDNFAIDYEEYKNSQNFDGGGRLQVNLETNGRFHTDWLNMMYPRLKIARDLLSDNGVIFISIDDNEQANLKKICDEVFGERNFVGNIIQLKGNAQNDAKNLQRNNEFILVYQKEKRFENNVEKDVLGEVEFKEISLLNDEKGYYYLGSSIVTGGAGGTLNKRPNLGYTLYYNPITYDKIPLMDYDKELAKVLNDESKVYIDNCDLIDKGYIPIRAPKKGNLLGCWTWSFEKINKELNSIYVKETKNGYSLLKKIYVEEKDITYKESQAFYIRKNLRNIKNIWNYSTAKGTKDFSEIMGTRLFENPKNLDMIKYMINISCDNGIILDYFAGSSTTADAVMQINAEDGGNRKFIMVQIPEETSENSEAYKSGYKYITDIGKERIRRAGEKILEENKDKENIEKLDIGFRVLKLDSSNMKDVYYSPQDIQQDMLDDLVENIKEDREDLDLLFQVMLNLGIELSSKIEEIEIKGKKVYSVNGNNLLAIFEKNIDDEIISEIAKRKPDFFVMCDASHTDSSVATNFDQIFDTHSPETIRRVL